MNSTILHISGDIPDAIAPAKTPVVAELLALTADRFDHRVYSINRRTPRSAAFAAAIAHAPLKPRLRIVPVAANDAVTALRYDAPPAGIYHVALLERLADWIAHDAARGPAPALVHGHKLTIEGILAARVAARLGVPYAVSSQGNTDGRVLAARPDLRPLLRRVWNGAAVAFPFTPWIARLLDARLGERTGPTHLLPCPTTADAILPPRATPPRLMSAFHLRNFAIKNGPALIRAAADLQASEPDAMLDLVGGGTPDDEAAVQRSIDRTHATNVRLAGPIAHADIQAAMNAHAAFVLPSRRESFGLVFVEALLAGCPIVYPAGHAVDGYFDGQPFATRVVASDRRALSEAMRRCLRDAAGQKAALAQWQASGAAERFRRDAIGRTYAAGLEQALAHRIDAPHVAR